jgi:hypothetical protein
VDTDTTSSCVQVPSTRDLISGTILYHIVTLFYVHRILFNLHACGIVTKCLLVLLHVVQDLLNTFALASQPHKPINVSVFIGIQRC